MVNYGVRRGSDTAHIVEDAETRCGGDYRDEDDARTSGKWRRFESEADLPDGVSVCGKCEMYPDETAEEVREEIADLAHVYDYDGGHFTKPQLEKIRETLRYS